MIRFYVTVVGVRRTGFDTIDEANHYAAYERDLFRDINAVIVEAREPESITEALEHACRVHGVPECREIRWPRAGRGLFEKRAAP